MKSLEERVADLEIIVRLMTTVYDRDLDQRIDAAIAAKTEQKKEQPCESQS